MTRNQTDFQQQVARLHRLTVYGRWLLVCTCWLTLGIYAFWHLKEEIALWFDYFTWAAVYYGFYFNLVPTLCLTFCLTITIPIMVWQGRNLVWGLPADEQRQLEKYVEKIQSQGKKHPLWKWIN